MREQKDRRIYPGPHMAAFVLWQAGFNLRQIYPRSSFYRHKRFLLNHHGIDIETLPGA